MTAGAHNHSGRSVGELEEDASRASSGQNSKLLAYLCTKAQCARGQRYLKKELAADRTLTHTMSFKTRPSTYQINLAPTGRAHCRKCKGRVEKGEVRIVVRAFVRPNRATSLVRCEQCIDAALVRVMLDVYGHTDRVPVDPRVSKEDAVRLRARLRSKGGESN